MYFSPIIRMWIKLFVKLSCLPELAMNASLSLSFLPIFLLLVVRIVR